MDVLGMFLRQAVPHPHQCLKWTSNFTWLESFLIKKKKIKTDTMSNYQKYNHVCIINLLLQFKLFDSLWNKLTYNAYLVTKNKFFQFLIVLRTNYT